MIPLDVAIIGGGAASLLILRRLEDQRAGEPLSVVMFSGALGIGGGQTSHSHAFIHGGHYVMSKFKVPRPWLLELPAHLQESVRNHLRASVADISENVPELLRDQLAGSVDTLEHVHFGTLLSLGASEWRRILPSALCEPHQNVTYRVSTSLLADSWLLTRFGQGETHGDFVQWTADEQILNPYKLLSWISQDLPKKVIAADAVVRKGNDHFEIEAIINGQLLTFSARTVIFAAGAQNAVFLDALGGQTRGLSSQSMYELAFRGNKDIELVGGVEAKRRGAILHTLLSRHVGDPYHTWLYTDGRTASKSGSLADWLRTAFTHFRDDFSLTELDQFEWHVSARTMHEWKTRHDTGYLTHWTTQRLIHGHSCAIFAWPVRLTLAPLLAIDVEQQVFPDAQHEQPDLDYVESHSVIEAPWAGPGSFQPWSEFHKQQGLSSDGLDPADTV